MVSAHFNLSNNVLEAELVPRSLQHHKAKSGTQINEKPLFCFMVPRRRLELPRLAAYAPQAYLYTIPTPGHTFEQQSEQTIE